MREEVAADGADAPGTVLRRLLADGDRSAAVEYVALQLKHASAAVLADAALACLDGGAPDLAEAAFRALTLREPTAASAHRGVALSLMRLRRPAEAAESWRRAIALSPRDAALHTGRGRALAAAGRIDEAGKAFDDALELKPGLIEALLGRGHINRARGLTEPAIADYRRCLSLAPGLGEAWWSLANLKTYRFDDADRRSIERALQSAPNSRSRSLLLFALGKCLDEIEDYAGAFAVYAAANAEARRHIPYDAAADERFARNVTSVFTPALMKSFVNAGDQDPSPIFIVGMPRAGSTLIEQILASHSAVEGLGELPLLARAAASVSEGASFPESMKNARAEDLKRAGARYLDAVKPLRSGRARFVDKLPNNFFLAGFALLALPRAAIIDARRDPLDVAVSNFRQHFAEGQAFSYALDDIAAYHRLYTELMAHWDAIAPGRILRVEYERLVAAPETEIRRLLDHCGLSFEPACLAFHKTARAVRTASSEQVRQPLNAESIGSARRYGAQVDELAKRLYETAGAN